MKKFLPILSFLLALLLLLPAVPTKAYTIQSVTTYVWYQDANTPYEEYQVSKAKTGDWIKVVLQISSFTNVSLSVTDPLGNSLNVKPTTVCTTSPCTFWFNTTAQAGTYKLDFFIDKTTHVYYNFQVDSWAVTGYSTDLPTVKMTLPDSTTVDVIKVPSSDLNASLTVTVDGSLAQPFQIKVYELGSNTLIGQSALVYPHGKSSLSVSVPFIINGKGYITLGKVKYNFAVYPKNGGSSGLSAIYYAVPAESLPFADFSVSATLPSTVSIGSTVSITGASVSVTPKAGYTRLGTGFYAPIALAFDGVYLISTTSNGTVILYNLSSSTNLALSKFKGSLPSIGSHTMSFGIVPLNYLSSPTFLSGASSVAKKDASVAVTGGGSFSIAIKDSAIAVGQNANVFINWDRSFVSSWLVNGDTVSAPLDVRVLLGSDIYNQAFTTISAKNGTKANITVSVPAVKYTYNSITGSATAALYVAGTQVATNSTGIPYKFAGFHVTLYRDGKIWTPPASGVPVDIYSAGSKVATVNATSSEFYVYTYPSVTFQVSKVLDPASKLVGKASASTSVGNLVDVVLNLYVQAVLPKDKVYVPKGYTGDIGVAILAPLNVGTYKLHNTLTAVSDPVANSTNVLITWDDSTKQTATITVNQKGTYIITYKANNGGSAYPDDKVIAYVTDSAGNNVTVIKSSLIVNPGYYVTIDYLQNNQVKIYLRTSSPFPLVSGKRIVLDVAPSTMRLVDYKNAEKTAPYNDYEFYLDDGGYVIYQLPVAGTEQQIVVNATATIPVDLSPTLAEYDFTHSVSQTFKVTAAAAPSIIPAVSTDVIILILTAVILIAVIYFLVKK